jgi:hypothetical protein
MVLLKEGAIIPNESFCRPWKRQAKGPLIPIFLATMTIRRILNDAVCFPFVYGWWRFSDDSLSLAPQTMTTINTNIHAYVDHLISLLLVEHTFDVVRK